MRKRTILSIALAAGLLALTPRPAAAQDYDVAESELNAPVEIDAVAPATYVFAGGVDVAVTAVVSADAGYRFTRIATDDPNVNAIYAAIKILFR